jgi:hypothetical protein
MKPPHSLLLRDSTREYRGSSVWRGWITLRMPTQDAVDFLVGVVTDRHSIYNEDSCRKRVCSIAVSPPALRQYARCPRCSFGCRASGRDRSSRQEASHVATSTIAPSDLNIPHLWAGAPFRHSARASRLQQQRHAVHLESSFSTAHAAAHRMLHEAGPQRCRTPARLHRESVLPTRREYIWISSLQFHHLAGCPRLQRISLSLTSLHNNQVHRHVCKRSNPAEAQSSPLCTHSAPRRSGRAASGRRSAPGSGDARRARS